MMRRLLLIVVVLGLSIFSATGRAFADADPYLGEISMFAGLFAPRGWAYCDGKELRIREHTALFSLLGTTYGGDGRATFKLPDMGKVEQRMRKEMGLDEKTGGPRYIIAMTGLYPSRN